MNKLTALAAAALAALVIGAYGCGSSRRPATSDGGPGAFDGGSDGGSDAGASGSDGGPDAGSDAGSDAGWDGGPDAGTAVPHTYVIDSMTLPLNGSSANALGFDLDGNGTVDNAFGNALSALVQGGASGPGLDMQGAVDLSIDSGGLLMLLNLQSTALDQASGAALAIYWGANPSPAPCTDPTNPTTCRQHLQGTGTFDVDPSSPPGARITGDVAGSAFHDTAPGSFAIQLSFLGTRVDLSLLRARAQLAALAPGGFGASKLGGAIPNAEVQNKLFPAMQTAYEAIVQRDCTGSGAGCGCLSGSPGATVLAIFDANADCAVTLDEFRTNNLIQTVFAPDLDIDSNGTPDALSAGFGITGIEGTFTPL